MPAKTRPARPYQPTAAEQHAEWLGLLRPDGPFLTLPVLAEALPHGLDTVPDEVRDRIRLGWAEVQEAPDLLTPAWIDLILGELLRYPISAHVDGASLPSDIVRGFRPDLVMSGPQPGGGRANRLHVYRRPAGESLTVARGDQPANAERAAQVCRDTGTPLALLTNGQHWVLVHARDRESTGTAVFDADLWSEEPVLLRAFATLLAAPRVLAPPADAAGNASTSLAGMFVRSAEALTQVTTTLGGQVRRAVELFVAELARLDRESGGRLLQDVTERDIYRGSLTVMMRVLFLLYAEEHRLLPVTDDMYAEAYAASTLYDQLDAVRSLHGDEIGDRRTAAWPRLLALFAAVYSGCDHPDLYLPAHGGSLFNPDRFPWLADAAITDRVVHEILDALLILRHRGRAAERLSYSSLGVEQIGHVYEGLLEFSCTRVSEAHVGLIGKLEPEVALTDLEAAATGGEDSLRAWLTDHCDLTARQLDRALAATPAAHQVAALHAACDNDASLTDRIQPYWGLLRHDLRGLPAVFPAGSVLFTQLGDRRATGTHYTPKPLADEVVRHTLAPLCFSPGPAEGAAEGVWRAKTGAELLKLKVLDPAMGSGAFLVSACRYLAEVLVNAWERDGIPTDAADLAGSERNRDDLLLAAQRMVAARCLYGVDRDDMAVELAKLSLWLVTLARDKPFGFLDHALRCGDSLVGITSIEQLRAFHLDPEQGRYLHAQLYNSVSNHIDDLLNQTTKLRESIESTVVEDARDAADKATKLAQANDLGHGLRLAADAVVGAALSTSVRSQRRPRDPDDTGDDREDKYDDRLTAIGDGVYQVLTGDAESTVERHLADTIENWLRGGRSQPIRPLHWPLEFPEVINRGGFDAVVGNPPFIGGKRVSGAIGVDLREYLKQRIARDKPGNADLCSYFLLRDLQITKQGRVGIIATNTIAQGDTREVGLDQIVMDLGWQIYRANKSQPWPGTASLEVSLLWVGHSGDQEKKILDGRPVAAITPSLDPKSRVSGNPYRLAANAGKGHIGSLILGTGFLIEPADAQRLIQANPKNKNVLSPYLNGEDLNSRPDCSARRWVINFHDWTIEEARKYPECYAIVVREVKPARDQNSRRAYRERWWRFGERQAGMLAAIEGLDRVIAITLHSKIGLPALVDSNQVFSHALAVFATDRHGSLALLSSGVHFAWWTTKGESSLETRLRYTPSDGFETFPQPEITARMDQAGAELDSFRRSVMRDRDLGLTKLYNLVHDPSVNDADIARLREIHVEIDEAVAEAYGWNIDLGHGFHPWKRDTRFTIAAATQTEILDLLLELNHARYAEEMRQGLHSTGARRPRKAAARKSSTRPLPAATPATADPAAFDDGLFPLPDALF